MSSTSTTPSTPNTPAEPKPPPSFKETTEYVSKISKLVKQYNENPIPVWLACYALAPQLTHATKVSNALYDIGGVQVTGDLKLEPTVIEKFSNLYDNEPIPQEGPDVNSMLRWYLKYSGGDDIPISNNDKSAGLVTTTTLLYLWGYRSLGTDWVDKYSNVGDIISAGFINGTLITDATMVTITHDCWAMATFCDLVVDDKNGCLRLEPKKPKPVGDGKDGSVPIIDGNIGTLFADKDKNNECHILVDGINWPMEKRRIAQMREYNNLEAKEAIKDNYTAACMLKTFTEIHKNGIDLKLVDMSLDSIMGMNAPATGGAKKLKKKKPLSGDKKKKKKVAT
jgi:hypothetical protein